MREQAVIFRESEAFPQDTLLELVAKINSEASVSNQVKVLDQLGGGNFRGKVLRAWLAEGKLYIEWEKE